jgi:hypothetical protein
VPSLIRYPARNSPTEAPHHLSTYRLATILTIPLAFSLFLFWIITHGNPASVASWELLPNLYLLVLVLAFVLPIQRVSRSGRYRTLATLKRISIGGLAEAHDGKFGDVLMADVLTSYAKVMGDLFIALYMFFSTGRSSTEKPDRQAGGSYLVPFIIAIPSMIRLRQCLIEYLRVRRANAKAGGIGAHGWGGQHLANALKYSSAFPVIILSALMRGYDPAKIGMSETGLFRLWYDSFHILTRLSPLTQFAGCSLSLSIPSTRSTGMSQKIGICPCFRRPKREMTRSIHGLCVAIVTFMPRKCTMVLFVWT